MKLTKINPKGFAHHVLAAVVVVAVAVGGTAYLVATHADSCNPASGSLTSGSTTSGSSTSGSSTSGSVTSGSGTNCTLTATCVINGVPTNPPVNYVIQPTVAITNTGTQTFVPELAETNGEVNNNGQGHGGGEYITLKALAPSKTERAKLPTTTVQYAGDFLRGNYRIKNQPHTEPSFLCAAHFNLPAKKS